MSSLVEILGALFYFLFFCIFICGFMIDLSKKKFVPASINITLALMNLIVGSYFLISSFI